MILKIDKTTPDHISREFIKQNYAESWGVDKATVLSISNTIYLILYNYYNKNNTDNKEVFDELCKYVFEEFMKIFPEKFKFADAIQLSNGTFKFVDVIQLSKFYVEVINNEKYGANETYKTKFLTFMDTIHVFYMGKAKTVMKTMIEFDKKIKTKNIKTILTFSQRTFKRLFDIPLDKFNVDTCNPNKDFEKNCDTVISNIYSALGDDAYMCERIFTANKCTGSIGVIGNITDFVKLSDALEDILFNQEISKIQEDWDCFFVYCSKLEEAINIFNGN